jgi:hypothetical protein
MLSQQITESIGPALFSREAPLRGLGDALTALIYDMPVAYEGAQLYIQ